MDDYDPTAFRRTRGDILAAWAICTMLLAVLLIGSLLNGNSGLDEQNVPVAAHYLHGLMRANLPAEKGISFGEQ